MKLPAHFEKRRDEMADIYHNEFAGRAFKTGYNAAYADLMAKKWGMKSKVNVEVTWYYRKQEKTK
jgi:hypothetical protein